MGGYGVYLVPDTPEAINDPTCWVFAYEANPKTMEENALQLATEKVFGNAEEEMIHCHRNWLINGFADLS